MQLYGYIRHVIDAQERQWLVQVYHQQRRTIHQPESCRLTLKMLLTRMHTQTKNCEQIQIFYWINIMATVSEMKWEQC